MGKDDLQNEPNSKETRSFNKVNKREYPCSNCNKQLSNLRALVHHKAKHEPPGGFLCSICNATFTTTEARQIHKREKHKIYHCPSCKEHFSVEQKYLDHVENLHASNVQPREICESCGSQFRTKNQLRYHVESNCGTEKRFKCDICNRHYKTNASLKTHMNSHVMGKRELCNFCGASFQNRGQLNIHERVHTGEKPYKCDKCDKAFAYRESLITHSTIHTGVKPFFCNCCNARFSCVGNLIKHRKVRPETCGLPEYHPTKRITPRPTKQTMPNLTDRKNNLIKLHTAVAVDIREKRTKEQIETGPTYLVEDMKECPSDEEFSVEYLEDLNGNENNCTLNANECIGQQNESDFICDSMVLDGFSTTGETNSDRQNDQCELLDVIETGETHESELAEESIEKVDNDTDRQFIAQSIASTTEKLNIIINEEDKKSISRTHRSPQDQPFDADEINQEKDYGKRGVQTESFKAKHGSETKSSPEETKSDKQEKVPIKSKQGTKKAHMKQASASTKVQDRNDISMEELNEMMIEKQEDKLFEQLEIVRQNSEASSDYYACKLCPLQYTTEYLVARHLERVHNFQLDKAREKLQFTKGKNTLQKLFRCKYCNRSYVNAARLKTHVGKHGADGRLKHKCSGCAEYFETEELACQHAKEQHRERLVCEFCEKEFKIPERLQSHVRYAHKGVKQLRKLRYMCHRCGKHLSSRTTMSDHERANCGESPIYRCETCGKHLFSFTSLKVHQTMHGNQLSYECGFCKKRYRTKGQLKVHERSHTGERPFRCEHCPKSFSYRESLLTHRATHTGIMRFACSGCDRAFTCIANLQAHRRSHRATCGTLPLSTKPLKAQ